MASLRHWKGKWLHGLKEESSTGYRISRLFYLSLIEMKWTEFKHHRYYNNSSLMFVFSLFSVYIFSL